MLSYPCFLENQLTTTRLVLRCYCRSLKSRNLAGVFYRGLVQRLNGKYIELASALIAALFSGFLPLSNIIVASGKDTQKETWAKLFYPLY